MKIKTSKIIKRNLLLLNSILIVVYLISSIFLRANTIIVYRESQILDIKAKELDVNSDVFMTMINDEKSKYRDEEEVKKLNLKSAENVYKVKEREAN